MHIYHLFSPKNHWPIVKGAHHLGEKRKTCKFWVILSPAWLYPWNWGSGGYLHQSRLFWARAILSTIVNSGHRLGSMLGIDLTYHQIDGKHLLVNSNRLGSMLGVDLTYHQIDGKHLLVNSNRFGSMLGIDLTYYQIDGKHTIRLMVNIF